MRVNKNEQGKLVSTKVIIKKNGTDEPEDWAEKTARLMEESEIEMRLMDELLARLSAPRSAPDAQQRASA